MTRYRTLEALFHPQVGESRTMIEAKRTKLALLAAGTAFVVAACAQLDTRDVGTSMSGSAQARTHPDEGRGSDELRTIVTGYAASGMLEEATTAFTDYVLSADGDQCTYCVSLLATVDTAHEDELVSLLFNAMDRILGDSYRNGTGEPLVDLALMIASSKNHSNWDRAVYYMANAVEFGISDDSRISVVRFLAEVGHEADARRLAVMLFEDEQSVYYQSDVTRQWIAWLGGEIDRQEALGSNLVAAAAE